MASREELLREKTYKGDVDDLPRRVFYTLQTDKALQSHRNSKAIAVLVEHLRKKNLISDDDIDNLLLEVID